MNAYIYLTQELGNSEMDMAKAFLAGYISYMDLVKELGSSTAQLVLDYKRSINS